MHKSVVEYAGVPVGIVVPSEGALKFVAVKFHVMGLDGHRFSSLSDVRRAIQLHLVSAAAIAA
ncbi:hypothetical protein JJB09_10675 [Rhizobium sp. KVB221]|uniref:Uncharacterized protein n=1 Tax=Rhizobium setariae TaxID=2801340 RepID=A0A936YLF4_9HYPH|nr:hypothetical protein [Rhizobium setariae]MBL0372493.1 hypothetical protein [Rhizobium setariae]